MKKDVAKTNRETIDSYDYLANSCSSTDCTGLIPALPEDEAELRSYHETYHFGAPKLPKSQSKP